jgi:hypothetical protein
MKAALKTILAMLFIFTSLSCTKDDGYVENLNEQGLTPCPFDYGCEYLYADNAEFSERFGTVDNGYSRIFWNQVRANNRSASVYIKASMKGNTFYIDNAAIQKGVVKLYDNCDLCFAAPFSFIVTGGFSKGKKLIDPTGKEKWLLETKLFIDIENTVYKDTLYIKQYYYPKP